jgi:hypothetical protein
MGITLRSLFLLMMRWKTSLLIAPLLGLCVLLPQHSQAIWPWHKSSPKPAVTNDATTTYTPPDKAGLQANCDPLREVIVTLNQTKGFAHLLKRPRIGLLKRDYYNCLHRFYGQEFDYLKHTDLQPRPVDNAFTTPTVAPAPKPTP